MLERYETIKTQQLHKFEMLERRVKNTGSEFPEELIAERRFLLIEDIGDIVLHKHFFKAVARLLQCRFNLFLGVCR